MWEDFPILVLDPYISNIIYSINCMLLCWAPKHPFADWSLAIHLPVTVPSKPGDGRPLNRIDATVTMGCNAHEPHKLIPVN